MTVGYFKNAIKSGVGNTLTDIYAAPAGGGLLDQTSYIIEIDIACTGATGVQASLKIVDSSEAVSAFLAKNVPVPVGSTIQIIDGQKLVLEPGDKIQAICDTPGEVIDVIVSLVENVNA
jgi:hypothetical protein